MIYLKRSKFLDVTNELFLFIFDISAVQSVHIKFWRWLDSNRGPVVLEETAVPTQPLSLPQKCDNLIRDNNLLRVNIHLLGKQVHQHTPVVQWSAWTPPTQTIPFEFLLSPARCFFNKMLHLKNFKPVFVLNHYLRLLISCSYLFWKTDRHTLYRFVACWISIKSL